MNKSKPISIPLYYKLKNMFGIGITGALKRNINHYKNSYYQFDSNHIFCGLTKWNYGYTVGASTYCDDPERGGFSMSTYINFYSSNMFKTRDDAEKHLNFEVEYLQRTFPKTTIERISSKEDDNNTHLLYIDGSWIESHTPHKPFRCTECHQESTTAICEYCGGICQENF